MGGVMTITIPGQFTPASVPGVAPGSRVGIGQDSDYPIRNLVREQHRAWAYAGGDGALVLGFDQPYSPPAGEAWTVIGRVPVPAWSLADTTWVLAFEGREVEVRVSAGGVVHNTLVRSSTTVGWTVDGTAHKHSAGTVENDFFLVTIEARQHDEAALCELHWVCMYEAPIASASGLPDGENANSVFRPLDDNLFSPDHPYSLLIPQTLHLNAQAINHDRLTYAGHGYPMVDGRQRYLGSCRARADGPYVLNVPLGAETIDVALAVSEVSGVGDVDVWVMTDEESFFDARVLGRRQTVTASSSAELLTFTGLPAIPGEQMLIWICYQSELKSTPDATGIIVDERGGLNFEARYREGSNVLLGYSMDGTDQRWALRGVYGDSPVNDLETPDASTDEPTFVCDLSGMEGTVGLKTIFRVSPHTTPLSSANSLSVYELAVLRLEGVSLRARGPAPRNLRVQDEEGLPSAVAIAVSNVATQQIQRSNVPQILIRSAGQGSWEPDDGARSGVMYKNVGPYFYRQGSVSENGTLSINFPVPVDPNRGAASGMLIDTLYACAYVASVHIDAGATADVLLYDCKLVVDGVDQTQFEDYVPLILQERSREYADVVSAYDTFAASANNEVIGPNEVSQQAYYQSVALAREVGTAQGPWPWRRTPVCSGVLPSAFPSTVTLEITNKGPAIADNDQPQRGSSILIVSSVWAWYGPRG